MGEKNPLKIYTIDSLPQKYAYSYGGYIYQSCSKNCEISNFEFLPFFVWDDMSILMYILMGRASAKFVKRN